MTSKRMKRYSIHVVFALLLLIMSVFGGRYTLSAFADATQYTSALHDLQTDKNFMPSAYPDNPNDITIQLIQIAESENGELFVYTYQPCQKTTYLIATELNMSLSASVDGTDLYPLELINVSGTLCKYKVDGVRVSPAAVRYYNITSIYREWIKGIDKEPDNDNTTNEVAYPIGKIYIAETVDGKPSYSQKTVDVIEITDSYVGSVRYLNKSFFYADACDCFFIAFTTDRPMHALYEADVEFDYYPYTCVVDRNGQLQNGTFRPQLSNAKEDIAQLKADGATDVVLNGIKTKHYTWKWIHSGKDFKAAENLSEEQAANIPDDYWVLRFFASELSMSPVGGGLLNPSAYSVRGYMPSDIAILRLKYEYMGKVYDLGAVSDKVTGGKPNMNAPGAVRDFFTWLAEMLGIPVWAAKALFFGVLALVVLAIALPVLSLVFPVFGQVLKTVFGALWTGVVWLLKGLLWLVLLPFKGIAALVRKIKNGKDGSA